MEIKIGNKQTNSGIFSTTEYPSNHYALLKKQSRSEPHDLHS